MNRVGEAYIKWAQRRSEPIQVALALTTLFLFLGVVAPILVLADWIRSRFQRSDENG